MRRSTSVWAAGLSVAAILLVAGCSSEVQGSATVGTAAISTTTADPITTDPSTTDSSTTDASTTDTSTTDTSTTDTSTTDTSTTDSSTTDTSTSESTESSEDTSTSDSSDDAANPATLDPTTEKWFTAFCDGASELQRYVSPDTTGQTIAEAKDTVVETYTNIARSASTTVGVLQATRPPTVAGGDDLQSIAIERFTAVSDVYGRGAQTIEALTPRNTADLKSAVDAVEAEAKASTPDSMAAVDPSVVAAARELPACKGVLG